MKRMAAFIFALSVAVQAQGERTVDSLSIPKNFENFNEFQIDRWGPVSYAGEGKCDILDLYQKNVAERLGYSTVVDYRSKQIKSNGKYFCVSWGLGLSFRVVADSNEFSENFGLAGNDRSAFSARSKNVIKKAFASDTSFFEVESITPVSYRTEGKCYVVDFLFNRANEASGFHGIIDMKASVSVVGGREVCTFWGLGVRYKRRDVVERVITKKRVIELIKVPPPKPDTVFVPVKKPAEKAPSRCCLICSCDNRE